MTVLVSKIIPQNESENDRRETFKDLAMVILTLVFVVLYALAFSGKLDPFKDNAMLLRLEPVVFVLIGFYFGRLPWRHGENALRDEINRLTQKVDAAQHAKEKAQQERESLDEKIRNAKAALKTFNPRNTGGSSGGNESVRAMMNILDS